MPHRAHLRLLFRLLFRQPLRSLAAIEFTAFTAFITLAAGCASSPPTHFYTLAATAQPAAVASTRVVAVGPVTLPALVDRPQIVVSTGPNAVRLDELNRWASPLQDNVARVVADNLAARLGSPRVHLFAQSSGSAAQYRVLIDVQRFASIPGESAQLDALWTVRRMRDGATQSGRVQRSEAVTGQSYEALAAAHSRALDALSGDLADALRALAD